MNASKAEKLFILMKQYGVSHFKTLELEIRMDGNKDVSIPGGVGALQAVRAGMADAPPSQAIPPVDVKIPHHLNEVAGLLKLNDEQLVDKLFPDYSQPQKGGE